MFKQDVLHAVGVCNMTTWDFTLSDEDMKEIAGVDIGHSEIVSHYDPAIVKMLYNRKIHV